MIFYERKVWKKNCLKIFYLLCIFISNYNTINSTNLITEKTINEDCQLKKKFYIFEGIDGCGKTTLISKLKEVLPPDEFFFTKEPYGTNLKTEFSSILKETLEKEDHLAHYLGFATERSHHIKHYILPQQLNGKHVISDRFIFSSRVYQSDNVPLDTINTIYKLTNHGIEIDIIFYCKIDPEIAIKRIEERKNIQKETNDFLDDFHKKRLHHISQKFDECLLQGNTKEKVVVLDMNNPIDEIVKKVLPYLQ